MQHSNHRTAALIASKPARIITSAVLAVALTATPMLSPVAAYAAWQEKFKRRRHDLQLQTANEWKNVWPGPVPGNGGILLLRKKIRLDGRKTSVNIGGINAAYEVFLNGRKVAAVSFRRAIAYPWGLNFTVGEKDVKVR